jgi:hypothetical protein
MAHLWGLRCWAMTQLATAPTRYGSWYPAFRRTDRGRDLNALEFCRHENAGALSNQELRNVPKRVKQLLSSTE